MRRRILLVPALCVLLLATACGTVPIDNSVPSPVEPTANTPIQESGTETLTLDQLKTFNGTNGQPSYIAVDGVVYDVSSHFVDGQHNGYQAGNDLTKEFSDEHDKSFLDGCTVMGTMQDAPTSDTTVAGSGVNTNYITEDEAKSIALKDAKLTETDVTSLNVKLNEDDGYTEYEVDFQVGATEYEYDIHAITGEILKSNSEPD